MNLFNYELIPSLRSEHLFLREMRVGDYKDMYEYSKDPEVTRYLLWSEHPNEEYTKKYLRAVSRRYKRDEYYDWAVVYHGSDDDIADYSGRMVGTCGFASLDLDGGCGEIGYVLNPAVRGHGIIPEAAKEVIRFGFEELSLYRIEARYMIGNDASRRVMEKLGMQFEGVHRSSMLVKGLRRDIGVCSILRDEFYGKRRH